MFQGPEHGEKEREGGSKECPAIIRHYPHELSKLFPCHPVLYRIFHFSLIRSREIYSIIDAGNFRRFFEEISVKNLRSCPTRNSYNICRTSNIGIHDLSLRLFVASNDSKYTPRDRGREMNDSFLVKKKYNWNAERTATILWRKFRKRIFRGFSTHPRNSKR